MENVIEVYNVTKTYRVDRPGFVNSVKYLVKPAYETVLKGVDFSVKSGEFFGLLGPNGAGKTTLIKTILGLVEPTTGKITVLGSSIPKETKKILPKINVVFSRAGCYWNLTGMDHLLFYGKIYRVKKLREKIKELVDLFELQKVINTTTDKYSSGEVMRLHLARSLLNDPELIILDEPTVGLDPYIALKVRDFFDKLNKERGVTVLLTTHYMEEADRLCDRIAVIDKGRIIRIGTADDFKKELKKENIVEVKARNVTNEMVNDLKSLEGVENVSYIGEEEKLRIILKDIKSFSSVLEFMKQENIEISSINTDTPTLEDVFLHMTGKRLRGELQ